MDISLTGFNPNVVSVRQRQLINSQTIDDKISQQNQVANALMQQYISGHAKNDQNLLTVRQSGNRGSVLDITV